MASLGFKIVSECRIARDGMAYPESDFIWWYGSVQGQLMWDEAGDLEYPGTPSDAMSVSDHGGPPTPVPLSIVCLAMDGTELPLDCDGMTSIGWVRAQVSSWLGVPRSSVLLYRNFRNRFEADVLRGSDDYVKAIGTLVEGEHLNVVVMDNSD